MFYDKKREIFGEWQIQGRRTRLPNNIAKKTIGRCDGCNCAGFPFCMKRIFPKTKINLERAEHDKICVRCGCTTCPSKRERKWATCGQCREYYLSHLHCRNHCWWPMDSVPFWLSKFDSRVYDGVYDDDDIIRECDTCQALLYPYYKRQPCNFEKHYASHDHFDETSITRKSGPSKIRFCQKCHEVKNYQCGYCSNKFSSANLADEHIVSKHAEMIKAAGHRIEDINCKICEIRPEWEKLKRRYGLHKWIYQKLKHYDRMTFELEFKNDLESVEEIEGGVDDCKEMCKPSYSDVCANQFQT